MEDKKNDVCGNFDALQAALRRDCPTECVGLSTIRSKVGTAQWLIGCLLGVLLALCGYMAVSVNAYTSKMDIALGKIEGFGERISAQRADINAHYQEFLQHEKEDLAYFKDIFEHGKKK